MNKKDYSVQAHIAALLAALPVGFLPVLWQSLQDFRWETNDDQAIMWMISRAGDNWTGLQGQLLCWWMKVLYKIFPTVEWWVITTIITIALSSIAILYLWYRRENVIWKKILVSFILCAAIWSSSARAMNFTRTAMIASTAGILLVLQGIFEKEGKRLSITELIIGFLFLLHGTMVRWQCAVMAVFFLGISGGAMLLRDGFRLRKGWFVSHLHPILCLLATLIFILGTVALDQATLSADQKEYLRYNGARAAIADHGSNYPTWDEGQGIYESLGFTQHALANFWYLTEDTEMFTTERMEQMSTLADNNRPIRDILHDIRLLLTQNYRYVRNMIFLLGIGQISLLLCVPFKRRFWLDLMTVDAGIGLIILISIANNHSQSYGRVFEPLLLCGLATSAILVAGQELEATDSTSIPANKRAISCILIPVFVFCVLKIGAPTFEATRFTKNFFAPGDESDRVTMRQDYMDPINQDRDHIYIQPLGAIATSVYCFGLFERAAETYCPNLFVLGGWPARAPQNIKLLSSYGINNPMRALFERDDVYSFFSPQVLAHLRENYDNRITVSRVSTIGSLVGAIPVVRYTRPLASSPEKKLNDFSLSSLSISFAYCDGVEAWSFSAAAEGNTQNISNLYCNITHDGTEYTYYLSFDSPHSVSSILYSLPPDLDINTSNLTVIAETTSGEHFIVPIGQV